MLTPLPRVLDHYDDNGLLLRRQYADTPVPALLKTAADLSQTSRRFEDDYALVCNTPTGREFHFPVVDAGNAVLSALYFAEYGDQLSAEHQKVAAANIKTALESFGFEVPDELTKIAAIDLGYSGEGESISLETLFGVSDDDTMEQVHDAFDSCSPRGKRRIMLRVKEAGVATAPQMEDYGRDTIGTDLEMALELRYLSVMEPEALEQLEGIRKAASANADPELLVAELDVFDLSHGLSHLYGRRIPDPYASVYGTTLQVKQASPQHVEVDGRHISAETIMEFARSHTSDVRDTFGDEVADQFAKDPVAVMNSLPLTHQQALARML